MSFDAINWATKQRVGNATAKHALLWLAFHANGRSGECFPSVELLMEEMEVGSKNTVKAALKTLIDAGLISSKREMKGNRVSRTFYCLNVDGSISDPSNIDGSIIDRSNIDADGSITDPYGSNSDRLMGQPLTPNKEGNKEENKERNREVICAPAGTSSANAAVASAQAQTPYPEDFDQSLFEESLYEEARSMGSEPNVEITIEAPAPAPQKRKAAPRRRPATPCPFDADASIPDEYKAIAEKVGIGNPQQVFSAFVNHALATDRRLTVWPAGFRTWCLNELRYHPLQTAKPKPLHQRTAADYDW